MLDADLFDLLDSALPPLGSAAEDGEEYREPPLDVLRYYRRSVHLARWPVIGRALAVVAVVRQPVDVGSANEGYRRLLDRLAAAVNHRFPPLRQGAGLSLGLTAVVLTPEPIRPEDDDLLARVLSRSSRRRVVPLGLFRVNLGQEAMAQALQRGPEGLFPEAEAVADALTRTLKRFVPPADFG